MSSGGAARRMVAICRVVLLCAGLSAACALAAQSSDPERGRSKAAMCDACHGSPQKAPQSDMPILAGQQHEFLVLQMFYFREGLRDAPQMEGLLNGFTDRDLEDVAAHYSAQAAPQGGGNRDPALHARGAGLSKALGCASCHLPGYRGQKHVPRIANQREDYLAATLKAYRDNKRTGTETSMNAAMYRVDDAEIAALAHYLAHQ
jgi:cytochrome c553